MRMKFSDETITKTSLSDKTCDRLLRVAAVLILSLGVMMLAILLISIIAFFL